MRQIFLDIASVNANLFCACDMYAISAELSDVFDLRETASSLLAGVFISHVCTLLQMTTIKTSTAGAIRVQ